MPKATTTERVLRQALALIAGKGVGTIPEGGHPERHSDQGLGINGLALAEPVTDPNGA
ncbi:hypothetical protein ACFWCB_34865 [Streptomyces sp. NPDC060048]|uniref:hypothetical protein n=1 Tax=unclassified Streptomyces TaxID=2593676 RepID=UPI0036ADE4DB